MAASGIAWAWFHALYLVPPPLAPELEGEDITVEGAVSSLPENTGQQQRFVFMVDRAEYSGKRVTIPQRLRLVWYQGSERVTAGQQWRLTVRLKRPHGMSNPAGLDYEAWLYQQGIRATGYIRSRGENRLLADDVWNYPVQRLRATLGEGINAALRHSPVAGLIAALVIGERQGISRQQWQVLTATGTNHLMAISGLHVGMVAAMLYAVVSWLWRLSPRLLYRLPAHKAGALAGLSGALVYAALAGFAIPTQRALIMVSVVMLALWLQRPVQASRLLASALLLVLLYDPRSVMDTGFWLSFCAVAVIIYTMFNRRIGRESLWWRWGRLQWVIAVGLLPLMSLLFQQASLSAPLTNLIAVPVMGLVVVPLALAGTLLLPLSTVMGGLLLQGAAGFTGVLYYFLEWTAVQIPSSVLPMPPLWAYGIAIPGILMLLAPRGVPGRWLGLVMVMPMLVSAESVPLEGQFRLTLLDVGQGLAAAVQTRHHLLLYDTGPRFSPCLDAAQAAIIPYLKRQGTMQPDRLILSHGDMDHAGGLVSLLEGVQVGDVLTSMPQLGGEVPQIQCHSGQVWWWDGVRFEVLSPLFQPGNRQTGENDNSCVLRVSSSSFSVLLSGDIEAPAERELVSHYGAGLHSDVLIAPHHGSLTSSTEMFIDAVKPSHVLFSVGYRNRHGFPHPEVLERYHRRGINQYKTDELGAITVETGKGLSIEGHRRANRRFWQQ